MNNTIRVGIVDVHPLFREGVIQAIRRSEKFAVVAAAGTLRDAKRIVQTKQPDVLLLDINTPGNAIELVRTTGRVQPKAKVVVLTELEDANQVTLALNAGAKGYVLKGVSSADLVAIVEAVCRGEHYVSPELAWRLLVEPRQTAELLVKADPTVPNLSQREREVLDHSCRGLTNPEIATRLGLSVRTVKYYKTLLFGKMRVRNRIEAMLIAQKLNMA